MWVCRGVCGCVWVTAVLWLRGLMVWGRSRCNGSGVVKGFNGLSINGSGGGNDDDDDDFDSDDDDDDDDDDNDYDDDYDDDDDV